MIPAPDLNAYDVEAAMNIIEGTARNMGIAIEGVTLSLIATSTVLSNFVIEVSLTNLIASVTLYSLFFSSVVFVEY